MAERPARPAAAGKPGAPAKAAAPPATPTMKAEVRARVRKGSPTRYEVLPAGTILGRDTSAGVPIPLEGVSREHARIRWDGRAWWVEDLKSTNGTFVNGERVAREKLQHLDVISLGRRADLVFVLRSPEASVPATRKGITRAALVEDDGTAYEIPAGEFTLGRSAACNVVAPETAVSKVHARIERSSDQLVLEDLSSSNGTFVNGTRVRTAILREGDLLDLAHVVRFKVVVETGEVATSGVYRAAPARVEKAEAPQFSSDWKTRYEWDPEELAAIAVAAGGARPAALDRKPEPPAGPKHHLQGEGRPAPAPAPGAEKPATAPAGAGSPVPAGPAPPVKPPEPVLDHAVARPVKIDAPAGAAPAAPPEVAARVPLPPGAEQAATPTESAAEVAPPPVARMPAPPDQPQHRPTLSEMAAAADAPQSAPGPGPVKEVRLTGEKVSHVVREPGRYEIGRGTAVPLRVDHTTVSRRHAAITLSADRTSVVVEDLGASNGTRVNGREIAGPQPIGDGDVVQIGEVDLKVALSR